MSRFQALTNNILDQELEMLRQRLGLEPSQRAELLREIASLAAWVIHQTERGRTVQACHGKIVEPLVHPAVERIRSVPKDAVPKRISLTAAEAARLAEVLGRGFDPPPALRKALTNLAGARRRPPVLRWKKPAA